MYVLLYRYVIRKECFFGDEIVWCLFNIFKKNNFDKFFFYYNVSFFYSIWIKVISIN